jgi:iron complex transport system substrate-binding protein
MISKRNLIFLLLAIFLLGCAQESQPSGIVSLSPANTEILFALDAGDQVIGVTKYCNYPPEAKNITKVGGYVDVDVEKVISLNPGLVVAEKANGEAIEMIEKAGIRIIVLEAKTVEDVISNIKLVGKAVGREEKAEEIANEINLTIEEIQSGIVGKAKPRVLVVVWHEPIYVAGNNTFIDDVIEKADGINAANHIDDFKAIGYEDIISINPDVILIPSGHGSYEALINNTALQDVKAIKEKRVYLVDQDILSRPSPRVVEAIKTVYSLLYES